MSSWRSPRLDPSGLVSDAHRSDEGLRVQLAGEAQAASEVNATLVRAGVGVMRLEPVRHSLEQRFLEVTSRLDSPAETELPSGGGASVGDGASADVADSREVKT